MQTFLTMIAAVALVMAAACGAAAEPEDSADSQNDVPATLTPVPKTDLEGIQERLQFLQHCEEIASRGEHFEGCPALTPTPILSQAPATEAGYRDNPTEQLGIPRPRRGVRLQWAEESQDLHLLVESENTANVLAKLEGGGNCWYVVANDDRRLPGACTSYRIAQGKARTYANESLACPPNQQMCADKEKYRNVNWQKSWTGSDGSVRIATECS